MKNSPSAPLSIAIIGASFSTGNHGLSALAWSSFKFLKMHMPNVHVTLIGLGKRREQTSIKINNQDQTIFSWPVRYCLNPFTQNHIFRIAIGLIFFRYFSFLKNFFVIPESTLCTLLNCDIICDITGGDSFSDIYGLSRFTRGFFLKQICLWTKKPFIMLPQTYGPFKTKTSMIMAHHILKRCSLIFSRDIAGVSLLNKLLGPSGKIHFCPDVAFIMDPVRRECSQTSQVENLKKQGVCLVGINISGLLYNGGYTRKNMFGLKCDYSQLMRNIITFFATKENNTIVLIPHVWTKSEHSVENDFFAAIKVKNSLPDILQQRIIILEKGFDQNETKYIIGLCNFFIAARMHAAIAALSQKIPAVGLAYSDKFVGVFQTANANDCAIDLRQMTENEIVSAIKALYASKFEITERLNLAIPILKQKINNASKEISTLCPKEPF